MRISGLLLTAITGLLLCHSAHAQDDSVAIKKEMARQRWLNKNIYSRQDAVDFIQMTYESFTPKVDKHENGQGVYKTEVKQKNCELVIEVLQRVQASSWKSDKSFEKKIVIVELSEVILDGNTLKVKDPAKPRGIYIGKSMAHTSPITSYSIIADAQERNAKFEGLHYDEHLQWAWGDLIDDCQGK